MNPEQIKMLIQSKNPNNSSTVALRLMYGEEFGGYITAKVKLEGDVFIPMSSWVSGRCKLIDVSIPFNTCIISLSVHDSHKSVTEIAGFKLVKDFRIFRGVYVSGLIRPEDHIKLKAKVVIGYDLRMYSLKHCTKKKQK